VQMPAIKRCGKEYVLTCAKCVGEWG
jgi:hypothetical protein